MVGLKCDIDVVCVPIEEGVFGCSYVPEVAGKFICTVLITVLTVRIYICTTVW